MQEILSLLEIYIDSKTIYNEWIAGDYFEAGLYTGKNGINTFFTAYAIILRYIGYFK